MKRLRIFVFAVVVVTCIVAIILYKLSWRIQNNVNILMRIGLENISIDHDSDGQDIAFDSDGIKVVGTVHRIDDGEIRPGIVLIHGSSPWGRSLALYRLMGGALAAKGFVVLRVDLRGYGDSGDPLSLDTYQAVDDATDVINAITYLSSLNNVDPKKIYLVGHSWGGGLAIRVGSMDERVQKIVSIGPPRRVIERMKKESKQVRARYSRDRKLKEKVALDAIQKLMISLSIDQYMDYFSSDNHKPIFLIDGEKESVEDRVFLKRIFKEMTSPKRYTTILNTGHYLNTVNFFGNAFVFFDRTMLNQFIDEIDFWIKQ